jgi:DNA-binding NarL/FixJ family response regulator
MSTRSAQMNSEPGSKIKVCIANNHELFRTAIVNLIKAFPRVGQVSEAENGEDCIDLYDNALPDVVLLDLEMPGMNGAETAEYIIRHYPRLKIIILTHHDCEEYRLYMLEMGVHSFLSKKVNPDELERAIYAVYDHDFYHDPHSVDVIRKSILAKLKSKRPRFKTPLSQREVEVLRLTGEEYTHREIAEKLSISEITVRNHRRNIMDKLDLKKTIGLVRYAYEQGLIPVVRGPRRNSIFI